MRHLLTEKGHRTPEQTFIELIDGSIIKHDFDKYPNKFFWIDGDDEIIMEYDQKYGGLWVHYGKIWSFFESEFGYNYEQISNLIKVQVEKAYNLRGVTPGADNEEGAKTVEKAYNLRGVTPPLSFCFIKLRWKRLTI